MDEGLDELDRTVDMVQVPVNVEDDNHLIDHPENHADTGSMAAEPTKIVESSDEEVV